jgi:putative ABC transport system permease protein
MELLLLIVSNLRRLSRSINLIWIWIVISTAATLLLSSASIGIEQNTLQSMLSLSGITQLKIQAQPGQGGVNASVISDYSILELRTIPGVRDVISLDYLYGNLIFGPYINYPQIIGVNTEEISVLSLESAEGSLNLGRGQIILGSEIASRFYFQNRPDKTAEQANINLLRKTIKIFLVRYTSDGEEIKRSFPFQVTGILKPTGLESDYSVFITSTDSERMKKWLNGQNFNRKINGYDAAIVIAGTLDDVENIHQLSSSWGYWVESRLSDTKQVRQTLASLRITSYIVGGMSLLSCIFGIFLTNLNLVADRKSEIGLMKAVGTTKKKILMIFTGESTLIGFTGGLTGIFLQFLFQSSLNNFTKSLSEGELVVFGMDAKEISFITPFWLIILVLTLVTCFALLGGLIPANKAANMDPINALRDL